MFGSLYKRVWTNKHLKKATKVSVYRAIVMASLLYGCVVGHQLKPPVTPRALPPALSAHHSQHPLERVRYQCRCPRTSGTLQRGGHSAEATATLGKACLQDEGPPRAKDHTVYIGNFPLASTIEAHQRMASKTA